MNRISFTLILFALVFKTNLWLVTSLTVDGQYVTLSYVPNVDERFMKCTEKIEEGKEKTFDCADSLTGSGDFNAYEKLLSKKNITFTQAGNIDLKDSKMQVNETLRLSAEDSDMNFTISGKSTVIVKELRVLSKKHNNFKVLDNSRLVVSDVADIGGYLENIFTVSSFAQFDGGLTIWAELNVSLHIGKGGKVFVDGSKRNEGRLGDGNVGFYVMAESASFSMADKDSHISVKNSDLLIASANPQLPFTFGSLCVEKTLKIDIGAENISPDDLKVLKGANVTVGKFEITNRSTGAPIEMKVPEGIKVDKNVVCDSPKVPFRNSADAEGKKNGVDICTHSYILLILAFTMAQLG